MTLTEHLESTNGEGEEIHKVLDQFQNRFPKDHRVILHHQKGIDFLVKKFGEEKKWIMIQHLDDDEYGVDAFRDIPRDQHDPIFKGYTNKFDEAKKFADIFLKEL